MLEEPDPFGRVSTRDRLRAELHLRQGVGILRQSGGDDPFDRRRIIESNNDAGGARRGAN